MPVIEHQKNTRRTAEAEERWSRRAMKNPEEPGRRTQDPRPKKEKSEHQSPRLLCSILFFYVIKHQIRTPEEHHTPPEEPRTQKPEGEEHHHTPAPRLFLNFRSRGEGAVRRERRGSSPLWVWMPPPPCFYAPPLHRHHRSVRRPSSRWLQ